MKSVVITEHGVPEVLKVEERPDPRPETGQVAIDVDGEVPDGFEAQTRLVFENVGRALAAQGAGWPDVVKLTYFDGRVEERRYFSGYRPAPEVFWVAPGYDLDELPPLPEHAKGVEGNALSAPTDASGSSAIGG